MNDKIKNKIRLIKLKETLKTISCYSMIIARADPGRGGMGFNLNLLEFVIEKPSINRFFLDYIIA